MTQPQKMGPSEALVETLVAHEVTHVFGIVGSAFMDALDLFPAAGIQFVPVAHEQGAIHMADGYARASGRHGVCIAQNGPGVTNFVTGVAAAYWAHSPVVFITPEAGSMTTGLGGFQETEQLPIFSKITRYQGHVKNPKRMAEIAGRCFDRADRKSTRLNSSHTVISYAVFCLKKKNILMRTPDTGGSEAEDKAKAKGDDLLKRT